MTMNFKGRARTTTECLHEHQMRIEVAGMSREVCESCGRVSLGYVEDHYRDWLDEESGDIDSDDD